MKPCGKYHPLPCGLDIDCEVPIHYYSSKKQDEEVWKEYIGAFE
jgi:hypothetical protein